jgi:hypothetical protein
MAALTMAMVSPAYALPTVDGNVTGSEGYAFTGVQFNIENGPDGVAGGKLGRAEGSIEGVDYEFFGLILPQSIVDNTYGDTKAADWGGIDHYLIGGDSLEGSDKFKIEYKTKDGDAFDLKLELDYAKINKDTGEYDAHVKFETKDGDTKVDLSDQVFFGTSLAYNYDHFPEYFGTKEENEVESIDSPVDLDGWIYEIMYEFAITKDALIGDWFDLERSEIHASPNKLGDKNISATTVPEPGTLLLLGCGLIGVSVLGRKKLIRKR